MGTGVLRPSQVSGSDLQRQEILQELLTGISEHRFGVELDTFEFVAAVTDTHDDAVFGLGGDG